MGSIGIPEILVIFVIALVVFGPRRLPELGRSLGKAIAEFKRATNDLQNTLEQEIRADEQRSRQAIDSSTAADAAATSAAPAGDDHMKQAG